MIYLPSNIFIRFFGIEEAQDIVTTTQAYDDPYYIYYAGLGSSIMVDVGELRQFVKSIQLIDEEGSLDNAKDRLKFMRRMMDKNERLEQAIIDYELCYLKEFK